MRTILRKNTGLCVKVRCADCFNYDKTRQVGYTCLIQGTSRDEPYRWEACFYFIHRTQTVLEIVGAP